MRYRQPLLALVWMVTVAGVIGNLAWAGPPFITDDPEPVAYQHWEINNAISKTWRQDSASTSIPSIDINYGLSQNMQLHVQPRYSYEETATDRHFGIDDTEIGVKYRFLNLEHGGTSFMAGIYPMLQLPTGDTNLGSNRGNSQCFIPLWLQYRNEPWTIYGGTGYRINPGTGQQNSVFLGSTMLYQMTTALQLGGEIFQETPDTIGGESTQGLNLGGNYNLANDYNLLFSAGRGLQNISATNQFSAYLALQVLY